MYTNEYLNTYGFYLLGPPQELYINKRQISVECITVLECNLSFYRQREKEYFVYSLQRSSAIHRFHVTPFCAFTFVRYNPCLTILLTTDNILCNTQVKTHIVQRQKQSLSKSSDILPGVGYSVRERDIGTNQC